MKFDIHSYTSSGRKLRNLKLTLYNSTQVKIINYQIQLLVVVGMQEINVARGIGGVRGV